MSKTENKTCKCKHCSEMQNNEGNKDKTNVSKCDK